MAMPMPQVTNRGFRRRSCLTGYIYGESVKKEYLKKREQKKLDELRDDIEDEQYLFEGVKLTEAEHRELRFYPQDAVKNISTIFKSKYDQPWLGWSEIPDDVKSMWFIQFKNCCRWEPEHDEGIKKLWKEKAAKLVRGSLADIRREKSSGKWLPKSVLEALKIKWETDPNFLNLSEQNQKNIAANTDGCLNRGGAITISEHLRRLGHKLGRDATIPEVFLQLNYNPKTKKWLNPRAEEVYNKYEELKYSKLAEGVVEKDIDDSALFYEASGVKNNKGRSYGCGSEAVFFESSSSRYTRFKTTHSTDPAVQDLQSRLTDVESQLVELRGLFEKMDGAFFRHGGSSSGVPRPCDDENEINPIGDDIEDDDD